MQPLNSDTIAAVDLGSNSFRLQIGRIVGNQIYPLDSLKEPVRLACGLGANKHLSVAACKRGLAALSRFGEMLRGFPPGTVRAVATNTLRVAKNARDFLRQAEAKLGVPIEVIAGREEARLIYLGVAHTLQETTRRQLVIDIGGGSTEFIIGRDFQPQLLESLYMGCVSSSLLHFPQGKVTRKSMAQAQLQARQELQRISRVYLDHGWDTAIGSSGTAKALRDLLELNGLNPGSAAGISREGLDHLCALLLRKGQASKLNLQGLRQDRIPVLPGGLAIMRAIFDEFHLEHMAFSEGALRLGVLYDLLGRTHHEDLRSATVSNFMLRYEVDTAQALRVSRTARFLFDALKRPCANPPYAINSPEQMLNWAACLHEIGISVAHASYHKHSAYILENADMPGFSRRDQQQLARLVLAHRGKLERMVSIVPSSEEWTLIIALRLAALLHRAREDMNDFPLSIARTLRGFSLDVSRSAMNAAPLTAAALTEEAAQWRALGTVFQVRERAVLKGKD
jgi:exopolyphosphatase/guanosine-5'-triphosphate,3'-diphosphate pyrophosphatase